MADVTPSGEYREVVDGVYEIICGDNGMEYRSFLTASRTPTLIDTGWKSTTRALISAIESIGIEPERLLITHGDPDHVGGFGAIVDQYQVETWVPNETSGLNERDVDHRFCHRDRIGPFEAIYLPGHKQDNYSFVDERRGILFTGDSLYGSDLRGLPPGYLLLPPRAFSQNLNTAEENLARLLDYEFDHALVSHGSSVLENAKSILEAYVLFSGHPGR